MGFFIKRKSKAISETKSETKSETGSTSKSNISGNQLFRGLTNQEVVEIYKIGKIKKYSQEDIIFGEDVADKTLYLIIEGLVKLQKNLNGQKHEVGILRKGECLGNTIKGVSAIVLESSTLMLIDNLSMNILSPGTQLNIYKNFIGITSERIDTLISREADLIRKNKYLGSKIRNFFKINDDEYNHSKIIQNILKNIPRLPMYTNNLVRLLSDTNVSTHEVVDQARLDPSLAGVILKTVNSSYYSLRNKVSDLQQAMLLLGFNQIYQLVVDKGIRSTMPDTPEFKELQYHSIIVSVIGFEIAKLCSLDKPVMLSTIGLLHDIGKSVIFLLKSRHQNLTMLINLLDYAKIGSLLMQEWNIPDIICKSVEYQKFPEFYPPEEMSAEYRKNIAILYLAHLCYEHLKGKDGKDLPLIFLDEYIKLLGFTESSVTELLKNQIMPSLYHKMSTYPEDVKQFLAKYQRNVPTEMKHQLPEIKL